MQKFNCRLIRNNLLLWHFVALAHFILVHRRWNIQNIWEKNPPRHVFGGKKIPKEASKYANSPHSVRSLNVGWFSTKAFKPGPQSQKVEKIRRWKEKRWKRWKVEKTKRQKLKTTKSKKSKNLNTRSQKEKSQKDKMPKKRQVEFKDQKNKKTKRQKVKNSKRQKVKKTNKFS